jgi:hypothetical protein
MKLAKRFANIAARNSVRASLLRGVKQAQERAKQKIASLFKEKPKEIYPLF